MYRIFLGLGSNLGDRVQHLRKAMDELEQIASVKNVSSVFRTQPYKMKTGNEFLNLAVEIASEAEPPELLQKLQAIERKLGRTVPTHMADREIDIDILLYENYYYEEHTGHTLEVPHPDLVNRRFALASLNEIAPDVLHPVAGGTVSTLLERCTDHSAVERTSLQLHSLTA
ncbi:MAG TPA: 2-amino-4-hydroxy-6-hydroxymethyldihydropteridine diphosphokinase [Bacteroidota bacterium]|jgi:2-amino-4-hydroxy-6-hydroxymethyldihydropteridine diphosphokinase|nr:2-amino-4-hydroxy-6-hydroxymethyldihydropteridine diphosphokinase [Bacteroidota bacterium]